jgi:hypothetical protein
MAIESLAALVPARRESLMVRGLSKRMDRNDWVLNLMYGSNVLLPVAVVYTTFHHEVMSVRFVIKRAVILFVIFLISGAGLDWITSYPMEFIDEDE